MQIRKSESGKTKNCINITNDLVKNNRQQDGSYPGISACCHAVPGGEIACEEQILLLKKTNTNAERQKRLICRMGLAFETGNEYVGIDFTTTAFRRGEYEDCRFVNCNFNGQDLAETSFIDCSFTGCNISNASLRKTGFQQVKFQDCKLLGLSFDQCNAFGLSFQFENCILNHASFFDMKLKQTLFTSCQMLEADFTGADLTGAAFSNCDLTRTIFENTTLQKADFRTAYGYAFDPEANRVKGALFALPQVLGLLQKYGIRIEGQ